MEINKPKLPSNPCDSANVLSKLLFTWTLPFFKKGYKKEIKLNDVFQPMKLDQSELLGNRLET